MNPVSESHCEVVVQGSQHTVISRLSPTGHIHFILRMLFLDGGVTLFKLKSGLFLGYILRLWVLFKHPFLALTVFFPLTLF